MEHKLGEIFEHNGAWYQCIVGNDCKNCAFNERKCYTIVDNDSPIGECCADRRKDNKGVIFKKLEKVGEPYKYYIKCVEGVDFIIVQEYILPNPSYIWNDEENVFTRDCYNGRIAIEIKQTKEDMEETNFIEKLETLCKRYNMPDGVRTDFISEVKEIIKDKEECNFKPFNLKAAKAGKPVCTRDGHKARIICFDYNGETGDYPIVALVHYNKGNKCYERVLKYTSDGMFNKYGDCQHDDDLMMLPEKKEGWVNVYKGIDGITFSRHPHISKEKAIEEAGSLPGRIDTVKVFWED